MIFMLAPQKENSSHPVNRKSLSIDMYSHMNGMRAIRIPTTSSTEKDIFLFRVHAYAPDTIAAPIHR